MKEAVNAAPNDAALHDALGSIEAQQKNWPEAQREFAAAVQLQPEMARARLHRGLAMQAQGEPGALEQLSEAARLAPDDAFIGLEYGKALAAAGQDEAAIPLFHRVLEREPRSTDAMLQLALAEQRTGKASGFDRSVAQGDGGRARQRGCPDQPRDGAGAGSERKGRGAVS